VILIGGVVEGGICQVVLPLHVYRQLCKAAKQRQLDVLRLPEWCEALWLDRRFDRQYPLRSAEPNNLHVPDIPQPLWQALYPFQKEVTKNNQKKKNTHTHTHNC